MKNAISFALGAALGLLIIAPPIGYDLPLMVNSFHWLYLVIAAGLFGMLLLSFKIPVQFKILIVYLFASCFLSQAPYLSFNAFILCVGALYGFLLFKKVDFDVVLKFIEAAFWLEVVLTLFQITGHDTLLNFDRPDKVYLGTVMQYMRFASVLAVMSPFLILKSRWYLIPIAVMCILSRSSSFALSLVAGVGFVSFMASKCFKKEILIGAVVAVIAYVFYDSGSWGGAIDPKCGGRLISWAWIVKTWLFDTSAAVAGPIWAVNGPFNFKWLAIGHGMDTFLPLFPVYKHDFNPFPQAHNSWLQMFWEIGVVGFGLVAWYCVDLWKKLAADYQSWMIGGLIILGVNMFFCFPDRMTQTMFLMVAYLAMCEKKVSRG